MMIIPNHINDYPYHTIDSWSSKIQHLFIIISLSVLMMMMMMMMMMTRMILRMILMMILMMMMMMMNKIIQL